MTSLESAQTDFDQRNIPSSVFASFKHSPGRPALVSAAQASAIIANLELWKIFRENLSTFVTGSFGCGNTGTPCGIPPGRFWLVNNWIDEKRRSILSSMVSKRGVSSLFFWIFSSRSHGRFPQIDGRHVIVRDIIRQSLSLSPFSILRSTGGKNSKEEGSSDTQRAHLTPTLTQKYCASHFSDNLRDSHFHSTRSPSGKVRQSS